MAHTNERIQGIAIVESDDDEPGIRGFASSKHHHLQPQANSLHTAPLGAPLKGALGAYEDLHKAPYAVTASHDPIMAAASPCGPLTSSLSGSLHMPASPAVKLDEFVLGYTAKPSPSAVDSLHDVVDHQAASHLRGVAIPSRGPRRDLPTEELGRLAMDSPVLSPTGSSSSSSSDDVPEYIPLKRLIKEVCVAGLQGRSRDRFCLSVPQIREICLEARATFMSEPMLLRLKGPLKIVGDLHGQFKDLMRLLKRGGMPPDTHYLFLGDYVDRGKQSLETLVLLLLLKLRYPTRVHMLRGNHESAGITKVYGFYDECKRRSSLKAWRAFVDVFNTLPVAALVGERIFCVHGGISPSLSNFRQIEQLRRPTDVPNDGVLADLLWSDPDPQVKEWSENDRGVSFCFGPRSLERFCRQLDIDLVVRGHMVVENGYEFFGGRRLVTVFSAPNYCGDFDNNAAVMNVSDDLMCSFDVIEPRKARPNEFEKS